MQLPEQSGRRRLMAAQLLAGMSLVFSLALLACGLCLVAVAALRSPDHLDGVQLALRLVHVLAGCAGLAAFSLLLRRCQAGKLWLGLTLCLASLLACAFLALQLAAGEQQQQQQLRQFGADMALLVVTASAGLALCLVQAGALYLLQTAREAAAARRSRRLPVPPPRPSAPPLPLMASSQRRPLSVRQQPPQQQQQHMAELWRSFDGPQHQQPMRVAGPQPPPTPPPLPPPPPYPELPAKPPPYTQSCI